MRVKRVDILPDPLVAEDGEPITSAKAWMEKRRPEILELFRTHVFGRTPVKRPDALHFRAVETRDVLQGKAVCKRIAIYYAEPGGPGTFNLYLYVAKTSARPVPAFLSIGHRGLYGFDASGEHTDAFPVPEILRRGYAAAIFDVNELAPDRNDAFDSGVHAIFDGQRTPEFWGALAAWGWGASRLMDYFETDPDIDSHHIALVGHSRGGKTALWCGVEDTRFALIVSNESGCTGAAVSRGNKGEQIADITRNFPYWFCENYKQYAGNAELLPIDQHELIALIAPRPVYVSSATEDPWADPESEFIGCLGAEPVYNLFGLEGVGTTRMPPPDTPCQTGCIGYHLRTGVHNLTAYDWRCFLDFADKHFGPG